MTNSDYIGKRWSELVAKVADEFWRSRQDPNAVFTHDDAMRKLKARLTATESGGDAFVMMVSDDDLLSRDLGDLARDFVTSYRKSAGLK